MPVRLRRPSLDFLPLSEHTAARILVIEDEPDVSALVAYQLAHAGFQVCTASTGREALRALDSEAPDLVVLDLMLPEVSGTEILRTMRSRRETKDTPVIILTARTAGSCCASRAHSRVTLRGAPAPSWRRATIVFSNLPLGARLSHL